MLERHPALHVVMVECGAGWLAWLLERMDEAFEEHAAWVKPKLAEPPSFYVRRQGHVTFGNDAAGVVNRDFTGIEPLLWASDYPHPEGTWPHTQETLDADLRRRRQRAAAPRHLRDDGPAVRAAGPDRVDGVARG